MVDTPLLEVSGPPLTHNSFTHNSLYLKASGHVTTPFTVYTQTDFQNARLITAKEYLELDNPQFEGQTKVDTQGKYRMYWSHHGVLYYTENVLD